MISLLQCFMAGETDPYFAYVSLLMHMNGANSGTVFTDQLGATITVQNSPVTSTTQSKFLGSSLSLTSSAALRVSNSTGLQFGTGDFCIEMWVRPTTTPGTDARMWSYQNGANTAVNLGREATTGKVVATLRSSDNTGINTLTSTTALSVDTWYHLRFNRVSGVTHLYINGVSEATASSQTQNIGSAQASIGYYQTGANEYFTGFLAEVRVTKGEGRGTANFSVPETPYPNN